LQPSIVFDLDNNIMEDNSTYRWTKLSRYLANESTPQEERDIECEIRISKDAEEEFVNARKVWDEATYALMYQSIDAESAFDKVKQQMSTEKPVKKLSLNSWWMGAAATVSLIIMSWAIWGVLQSSKQNIVSKEIIVAGNQTHSVILSDGSQVDVNGGSRFLYPETFVGDKREVELTGEAFFKVAANKEKPFFINAGPVSVRVVGTQFNVSAFEQKEIEVVVSEGVVEVSSGADKVVLTKGFRAVFDRKTGSLIKSMNSNPNFNAWKTHQIVFKESSLQEVINVLEDVYKVDVTVDDTSLLSYQLTASFKSQSLDNVLNVVSRTFHLKYVYVNGVYHLQRES